MKGSAFKLGNVATKSALKQTSPMKTGEHTGQETHEGEEQSHRHELAPDGTWLRWNKGGELHKKRMEEKDKKKQVGTGEVEESPAEMKSPMKQDERSWLRKGWDEATQIGEGLKKEFYIPSGGTGSPDPIGSRFMKGYTQEEQADDPVLQAELLAKKKLKRAENRRIEIAAAKKEEEKEKIRRAGMTQEERDEEDAEWKGW